MVIDRIEIVQINFNWGSNIVGNKLIRFSDDKYLIKGSESISILTPLLVLIIHYENFVWMRTNQAKASVNLAVIFRLFNISNQNHIRKLTLNG